jgi:hypothetical protein
MHHGPRPVGQGHDRVSVTGTRGVGGQRSGHGRWASRAASRVWYTSFCSASSWFFSLSTCCTSPRTLARSPATPRPSVERAGSARASATAVLAWSSAAVSRPVGGSSPCARAAVMPLLSCCCSAAVRRAIAASLATPRSSYLPTTIVVRPGELVASAPRKKDTVIYMRRRRTDGRPAAPRTVDVTHTSS